METITAQKIFNKACVKLCGKKYSKLSIKNTYVFNAMTEYAKQKCEQQRKICANKAFECRDKGDIHYEVKHCKEPKFN